MQRTSSVCLAVLAIALFPGHAALACAGGEPGGRDPQVVSVDRVQKLLRDELREHWYPAAIDRDRGGFHQNFKRDWSPLPDENRFLVYQARMTWTAAAFAEHSPRDKDEFARYALHGIRYLHRNFRDGEQGGFHWVLNVNGALDPALGDEKHVYGTAFALYAASETHRVLHDDASLAVARDAFAWLEKKAHDAKHGGYFEAVSRAGEPITSWKPDAPVSRRSDRLGVYYGSKTMNSHIHLLEALAAYKKITNDPLAEARLREVFQLVRDKIAVEPGALCLYFTRDWRALPAHDSFGHDVETAYLLVEATEALGAKDDARTWSVARSLVDHALDWGWDERDGGFYDKGDVFAGGPLDSTKVWWVQAEGLNALLLMHVKFGKDTDKYFKAFTKEWQFIEKHMIDSRFGGWYGEVSRDGAVVKSDLKATQWKANYHTSRALMNVVRMLGELASVAEAERGKR